MGSQQQALYITLEKIFIGTLSNTFESIDLVGKNNSHYRLTKFENLRNEFLL